MKHLIYRSKINYSYNDEFLGKIVNIKRFPNNSMRVFFENTTIHFGPKQIAFALIIE